MVCKTTPSYKELSTALNDKISSHRETFSVPTVRPIWRLYMFNKTFVVQGTAA